MHLGILDGACFTLGTDCRGRGWVSPGLKLSECWSFGFRGEDLGFRVLGFGFRVLSLGFRVLGFRV